LRFLVALHGKVSPRLTAVSNTSFELPYGAVKAGFEFAESDVVDDGVTVPRLAGKESDGKGNGYICVAAPRHHADQNNVSLNQD
jgi:hypothetical protein